jgi:CHAT domain-containing protein/tetratricopeptide (TPR) repeat protein
VSTRLLRAPRAIALIAATLLIVAAVAWVVRGRARPQTGLDSRPELVEIISALAEQSTRPVEGRLAGAFAYAPPPVHQRGSDLARVSPDVRIAAARIEKRIRGVDTPSSRAALGVARLTTGDWDDAVDALEQAVERDARNMFFLNDLSVAYLMRARALDRPEDAARSLAAADRAVALDVRRPEPHFNRALALSSLHMTAEEQAAWEDYATVEPAGPWRDESAQRLRTLVERTSRPASDSQALRERIEDDLLRRWAAAIASGTGDAGRLLEETSTLAEQLAADGGDTMPRDEVALIARVVRSGNRAAVGTLAEAHTLYVQARQHFLDDDLESASDAMGAASARFRRAGSRYALWAPVFRAFYLRNKGEPQAALNELRTIPLESLPPTYYHLRGRVAWTQGVALDVGGRYDLGRPFLKLAVEQFRVANETDNLVGSQTILAEAEWFLGDYAAAWRDLELLLAHIERHGGSRRNYHYWVAATAAIGSGLPETALEFQSARVRLVAAPRSQAEAYMHRARTYASLGRHVDALNDLRHAENAVSQLASQVLRDRNTAEINAARAEVYAERDCTQADRHANAAIAYFEQTPHSMRMGDLLAVKAKCRASSGDYAGARTHLLDAVRVFESRQGTFESTSDRAQAFARERTAFKDLVRLELTGRGDERAAFEVAERARAGTVREAWTGRRAWPSDAIRHDTVPSDVAVLYYESLPDRVVSWVITREGRFVFTRPIARSALASTVARIQEAIRNERATVNTLQPIAARLVADLIAPALEKLHDKTTIVFVPDGPLFALPFGALPDANGRALVETWTIAVAPSFATFLAASSRLQSFVATDVLAVGDGHDVAATGLPPLGGANPEAIAIAAVYGSNGVALAGADATKQRFYSRPASVIHFAGHTVLNPQFPGLSHMLFAPDAGSGDQGLLLATELMSRRFPSTRVVVLATCEGAAGRVVEGEGAISIARTFFASGVPAVVASLWSVADDQTEFMTTLHEQLRAHGNAARALQYAQRSILSKQPDAPIQRWGGFIMLGGLPSAS